MSILIKGMKMPVNCEECDVKAVCKKYWKLIREHRTRPSWCPLVEIPPPGRLIDADELRWCYDNSDVADDIITKENYDQLKVAVAVVRQTIDDAPTIIEAEEE